MQCRSLPIDPSPIDRLCIALDTILRHSLQQPGRQSDYILFTSIAPQNATDDLALHPSFKVSNIRI